jgi:hypothetical protein
VDDQTLFNDSLSPGQRKTIFYVPSEESHYAVDILYRDGMRERHDIGYVAPLIATKDMLTITADGVTYE